MNHSGKAMQAALRILFWSFVGVLAVLSAGVVARFFGGMIAALAGGLLGLWLLFALFTLYFFRDPEPVRPADPDAVVSPAHGTVDVIEECQELEFMAGRCHRISIFLNVFNVHVQRAPVSGLLTFTKSHEGGFLSATRTDCGATNENVLIGFETPGSGGRRIGTRLIAGLIARRILVWAAAGQSVVRSDRISLIQFGSRCDVYLPLDASLSVRLGDRVKGGESILARLRPGG